MPQRRDGSFLTDAEGRTVVVERSSSAGAPNALAKGRRARATVPPVASPAALIEIAGAVRDLASRVRRLPRERNQSLFVEVDDIEHAAINIARRLEGIAK